MRYLIAAAAALFATPAMAQPYVTAGAGLSVAEDPCLQMKTNRICVNLDNGYTGMAGVGYDFGPVRIEAEGVFARSTVAEVFDAKQSYNYPQGSQSRQSAMVNALVDIPLSRAVTLYGGGGAGISLMQMRATKPNSECKEPIAVRIVHDDPNKRQGATGGTCNDQGDGKETGFTWQAIAGLDFKIGKGWSIGPQARYVAATGIHTAGKSLRTRETRFRSDETYRSINALVAIRKSF